MKIDCDFIHISNWEYSQLPLYEKVFWRLGLFWDFPLAYIKDNTKYIYWQNKKSGKAFLQIIKLDTE